MANLIINSKGETLMKKEKKGDDKSKLKSKAKHKTCYYFGKRGHFTKNCHKRQNELKEKNDEGNAALAYNKGKIETGVMLVNKEKKLNKEGIFYSRRFFSYVSLHELVS